MDTQTEQPQPTGGNIKIPEITKPKPETKGKGLQQLFISLLVLTIGLFVIVYIGDWLAKGLPIPATTTGSLQEMLRSTGMTVVYALGGITALVFVAWLFVRRSK
ncbi:MAG: hypothetical protein V1887_04300 [Candidatus Aenigmatarchaeota archaeon]